VGSKRRYPRQHRAVARRDLRFHDVVVRFRCACGGRAEITRACERRGIDVTEACRNARAGRCPAYDLAVRRVLTGATEVEA